MLNVSSDTVCFLISRAREFHAKEEVVLPDVPDSPADDWGRQVLADHVGDETYQEFVSTLNDLEPDQQHEVVALMWLGRDDFTTAEWQEAVAEAQRSATSETASYLLAHPLLADFLQDGLDKMGFSCDA